LHEVSSDKVLSFPLHPKKDLNTNKTVSYRK